VPLHVTEFLPISERPWVRTSIESNARPITLGSVSTLDAIPAVGYAGKCDLQKSFPRDDGIDVKRLFAIFAWLVVGVALSAVFWPECWRGDGLIGGDLYTYFFPQKVYYAEALWAGEFPFWNHLVGHGYPVVAESQTGAFYPPNLLAYRIWDANTAYLVVHVFHYVLAFLCSVALGRAFGFSVFASAFVGVVFVYGWFPARLSLEWAILTGAWMPAAIWCVEKLMASGSWRYAAGLAFVLAMQVLPGHFHIAFITQVLIALYAAGRIWITPPEPNGQTAAKRRWKTGSNRFSLVLAGVLFGFGLAAMQLLPTWELKTLSQRSAVGTYYDPAYGNIPPIYLTQIVAPFWWYGDPAYFQAATSDEAATTNAVEAHLYFGLVTVALLIFGIFKGVYRRDRGWLLWGAIGILAAVFATGWLLPLTTSIPGFHYFRGVGRWGIITTLAAALLGGAAFDDLLSRFRSRWVSGVIAGLVLVLVVVDLRIVRGLVGDGIFVENPPIHERDDSPIRKHLMSLREPPRLFCRGANLATLSGASSTPTYLGIGPDEYFDPETAMPEPLPFDDPPTPEQIDWLRRAGVTHILSFSALDPSVWPAEPVWAGYDPLLCRAWARGPNEPLHLYRLKESRGRAEWLAPENHDSPPKVTELTANLVEIRTNSKQPGTLILTALLYPGWHVTVDGEPREPLRIDGMYRGVDVPAGEHIIRWEYRPASQKWGFWISGGALLLVLLITGVRINSSR
jgi:hypothetical protein